MGVAVVVGVLLLTLAWFFWPGGARHDPTRTERPGVDRAELEAAERDAQEAADHDSVRDWGPGTGQKPLP